MSNPNTFLEKGFAALNYFVPALTLIIGIVASIWYTFNPVDEDTIKFILLLLTFFLTSDFITRIYGFRKMTKSIENVNRLIYKDRIDPNKASLLELLTNLDVVLNAEDRSGLENMRNQFWDTDITEATERNAQEIWVATPKIIWEKDKRFSKVIFGNIKYRKVKIYQLYSDTAENRHTLAEHIMPRLKKIAGAKDKVKYVPVPPEKFPWYVEHVLYDRKQCILIKLIADRHFGRNYNIQLPEDMTLSFLMHFADEWNGRVTDLDWKINPTQSV